MSVLTSPSAKTAVLGVINETLRQQPALGGQTPAVQLTNQYLDVFTRFQFRTLLTLTVTGTQDLYQKESIRFAYLVCHPSTLRGDMNIRLTMWGFRIHFSCIWR
jgi:hypothetical protein